MVTFTRREILQLLALVVPGLLIGGCKKKDVFDEERVCIHVYDPKKEIPSPLLAEQEVSPRRSMSHEYFTIGIPELILCTSSIKFLDLFQYFWPISHPEFQQMQDAISVEFQKREITDAEDIENLAISFSKHRNSTAGKTRNVSVLLTYNEYTCYWSPGIIRACRSIAIDEIVIIKDPTRSPYLCDYPSQQKGFKRQPL